MRQVKIAFILILVAGLFYLACEIKPEPGIEVVVDTEALEEKASAWPVELQVIKPQDVDPKGTIRNLAEILNLPEKVEEKEEHLEIVDGTRYLEVSKISGAVFYGEMDRLWTQGPIPDQQMEFKVLPDEEAEKMALELLMKLGFSSTDLSLVTFQSEPKVFEILKPDQKEPTKVIVGKTVSVRRTLNQLPVVGPGSKIKVYIEGDGGMAGWLAVWRPFGGAPKYQTTVETPPPPEIARRLSIRSAIEQLKENPVEHKLIADVEQVIIKDVQLAYYAKSASEKQQYLQPVYAFSGVMRGGKDTERPFELPYQHYIIAIEKPFEAIWDRGIEHKAEPRKELKIPIDEDEEGERR